MTQADAIVQTPSPGKHLLRFCGDTITFRLALSASKTGKAWLRTNIGQATITRNEIIRSVENEETLLGRDWFDIPMVRMDDRTFQVTLPLCEVGHFEAKGFFWEENAYQPIWPEGTNSVINVEPADTCCANIIYNAFVRQFGPNKSGKGKSTAEEDAFIQTLDEKGYAVIPPSGKFRDFIKELDFIIGELGCRMIQLLPIHPTPTTYGRMGRFGSPFASLSFKTVDPALAVFDPKATPLEQFIEVVDAIHARQAKILLDIAINHTGWAARLHDTHPQWLVRDAAGTIEVPSAWGVRWEDLTKLDYSQKTLWRFMADIFLYWCRRGVDGFRCDAGYMIPVEAWKYIVASVREQYPDTLFFLEGLGGKISVTRDILNWANFNWAYSELFQNYDRGQIESYLPEAIGISKHDGILIHFSETHDNNRLASRSHTYAKMRNALCALGSHQGGFGFANGVEWFAEDKIIVHNSPSLNWGASPNQVKEIRRLTTLLKVHPAFFDRVELELIQKGEGNNLVIVRHHPPSGKRLIILVNLDDIKESAATWNRLQTGIETKSFIDLLTGETINFEGSGENMTHRLSPGEVRCLSPDTDDIDLIQNAEDITLLFPERILKQRRRAKALEVILYHMGTRDLGEIDPDREAQELYEDPVAFCRSKNPSNQESRVITWRWPQDIKREVMVPPGHFLLILAETPFRSCITDGERTLFQEDSLLKSDGKHFALFSPLPTPSAFRPLTLKLSVHSGRGDRSVHKEAPILLLPEAAFVKINRTYHRHELLHKPLLFLATNGRGAMLRTPVSWGELNSRYDALLAANLHPDYPEDRWIMFSRCRAWVVFQGYSQEINKDCTDLFFSKDDSRGIWQFHVPTGQGEHVLLNISVEMFPGENAMRMVFFRHPAKNMKARLADNKSVRLILRPDIESRNFHETTKAYAGPEHQFPKSITQTSHGFTFAPDSNHALAVDISNGQFTGEPEWQYMVHRRVEADRGLDADSDLFSPGYFSIELDGNQTVELTAHVSGQQQAPSKFPVAASPKFADKASSGDTLENTLRRALDHFVVKRGKHKSIIAGYPWFLDWGRDALIVLRGMIADGRTEDVRAVLMQFGQFEKKGMLPNMIRGEDAGNRNTSDAPLWFFLACEELMRFEGNQEFLDEACGNRTIREILTSMGNAIMKGVPNGIYMDNRSGLVFSPVHFTWMDTNHPAGTPREGYPIEIQALWYATLSFLSRIGPNSHWKEVAGQVQRSISDMFFLKAEKYLADCLHAKTGQSAHDAEPGDALRPNQLFAITLGAVTDRSVCENILAACEELLIPGAIRSLADRPVRRPLPVYHQNFLLNDPERPYQGKYSGDEDTRRKPAYHNGTAWTWVFPSFCEAWVKTYGNAAKKTALAWLTSCAPLIESGCVGNIPEILDGDYPHQQRGCDAQAWGVSEALRVLKLLTQ